MTDVTEQHMSVALRLVPALFAIATVVVGFLLARRYFGKLAAWLTAFFYAVFLCCFWNFQCFPTRTFPRYSSWSAACMPAAG